MFLYFSALPPNMPHNSARKKAIYHYDAAFHLLNVTLPLVKDPKLLFGVINNLNQSLEAVMDTILLYERQLKLVPNYLDNFQSKFNLFRYKCVRRNKIPIKIITMMLDLRELEELQKKCPIAFQRGNKYILSTKNYQLKSISIKEIRESVSKTKEFIDYLNQIITI